jgi:hypothetical protein
VRDLPIVLATLLVLTACDAAEQDPTTTLADVPATATTQTGSTTTTTLVTTTSLGAPDSTTTTLATIDVEFRDGAVTGADRFQVDRDDVFDIWVLSDVADELHVHGYDIFFDLEPGAPLNVTFVVEVPGIFEVELESGHTLLFEIEVSG